MCCGCFSFLRRRKPPSEEDPPQNGSSTVVPPGSAQHEKHPVAPPGPTPGSPERPASETPSRASPDDPAKPPAKLALSPDPPSSQPPNPPNLTANTTPLPDDDPPHPPVSVADADTRSLDLPPIPDNLPSQVDETLDSCPKFRIVLIGNSGVGKSSLVKYMFNIDPKEIDVAHDRAGKANIEREYQSIHNPRFILHDSNGFETGSAAHWDVAKGFIHQCQAHDDISKRIHAIWFCLQTPREGVRLLERGDEHLLQIAFQLNIPIIAVFTKFDILVKQLFASDKSQASVQEKQTKAKVQANISLDGSAAKLQEAWKRLTGSETEIDWVKMSTEGAEKGGGDKKTMLNDLTVVTRAKLRDVEGDLWKLWATAQQINARQKVELSIHEGLKKYWLDLGSSVAFEDNTMLECIHRIHDDVLKVWNFRDPQGILPSAAFIAHMLDLVAPLIDNQPNETRSQGDNVSTASGFVTIVQGIGLTGLGGAASAITLGGLALQFFYNKYQKYDLTAKVLANYIVNLVLIMHEIFTVLPTMHPDPPRALSRVIVVDALNGKRDELKRNHFEGRGTSPGDITFVIKKRLGFGDGPGFGA